MENSNKRFLSKFVVGIRIYVVVIALFILAAVLLKHYTLAVIETGILALLLLHYLTNRRLQQQQLASYVENLAFHLDNATKDSMTRFPLPMLVMDLTGVIVWYNRRFGDMVGNSVFDKPISQVIPSVQVLNILENKENIRMNLDFQGRHFEVVGNIVEFSREKQDVDYSIVLYFIDRSEEKHWNQRFLDIQPVSGTLLIDNYDDLMKNTPDDKIPELASLLEQRIRWWVSQVGGIAHKVEKDRYMMVCEHAGLQKLMERKFDLLDAVQDINVGNKMPPTLSIGIGKGETLQQSDEYARASLDMALGRGGDQVVIKDNEQFRFFGGRSESVERNSRVKARVVAYALRELIDQSRQVFITGHQMADADSFGACVGLCKMAKLRGAQCYIVCDNPQGATQKMIQMLASDPTYHDTIITEAQALQIWEKGFLMIVADTHKPAYVDANRLLEIADNVVLIDHHRRGAEFIEPTVLTYHEPYSSSTCEMVTEIIRYMMDNPSLTPEEAQALFAGIALDTKNFSVKTGVRTFEAASFLRRMGVDTVKVKRMFQNDLSLYVKRARIVSNAEIYQKNIAISRWDEEDPDAQTMASQAADELLNVSDVSASFVLCQGPREIVISGRSLGSYNVQLVLEQLGGGGHMTVAGAQIKERTMHEAVELLKEAIDRSEQ